MAADVVLDRVAELPGQARELGVTGEAGATRARKRLLDAAEQIEVDPVLVVERVTDLALEAHRRSNIGI
jgi:hypothetical protein